MENVEKKPKSTKNTNAKDVDKKVSTSKASKANATTQERAVKSNASKQSASKRGAKTEPKQTDEVVKGQEVAVDTANVERNSTSDDFSIQSQGERIKKNAGKNSKRKKAAVATAVVLLLVAGVTVPTAVYLSRRKVSVDIANNIDIIQEYTINVNRGSTIKDIVPQEITGYTFVGFYKDAELTVPYKDTDKINKNMTIYAKYEANVYKVTFPTSPAFTIEGEDIVNNQVEIEYNTEYRFKLNLATGYDESDITVKVNGEIITPDKEGYYTLTIYGDTLVEVEGVEINTYEVTFYDSLEKNEMYQTLDIQYNQLCTYTGITPTKHSTHTYTYKFIGWVDAEGNEVDLSTTRIVTDLELFANFREEYIEYTISKPEQVNVKFGDLYLSNTATLHYGDIVEITYDTTEGHDVTAFSVSGAEKVDGSENQYRITGNLVVTYSEEIQKFTVTWKNWDGSTLETDTLVPYGTTPEYNGETPTREETASHSYTFTGWDQELNPVTGDITYTAIFDSEIKASYDFTIEDGIITSYTGTDTYVVLPSTYSLADMVETRSATLTYEELSNFDGDFANAPMALKLMYLGGFYCTINGGERTFYKNIFEFTEAMNTLDPDWQTNESLFPIQIDGATYEIVLNGMDDGMESVEYAIFPIQYAMITAESLGKPFSITFSDGTALENQTSAEQTFNQMMTIFEQKEAELKAQNPDITDEELMDQIYRIKFTTAPFRTGTVVAGDDFEVTGIADGVFANSDIETIRISENITSIGTGILSGCSNLKEIIFSATNCETTLNSFIGLSNSVTITVTSNVRRIPSYFLVEVSNDDGTLVESDITPIQLKELKIENDIAIEGIGAYAFYGSSALTNVDFMKSGNWVLANHFYVTYGTSRISAEDLSNNVTIIEYLTSTYSSFYWLNGDYVVAYPFEIEDGVITDYTGLGGAVVIPSTYSIALDGTIIEGDDYQIMAIDSATWDGQSHRGSFAYSNITSIVIPDSVTSIGNSAFSGCTSLTDVYYTGDINDWVSISFGVNSANPLYYGANLYINGNELVTEANIDTATSINAYAFRGCTSITSVTIGNQVTSIGSYAFQDCSSLTSVTIGDSVTSIGSHAFYGCRSLTSITIPNSVTSIGYEAFYRCTSLTSITIPDGVTSIGEYAFWNCTSLTSITIGEGVTSIGSSAFEDCTSLTSVTIESNYAYANAGTGFDQCGYLLQNATEVRVLISCIEEGSTNSYLENTATFTKTTSEDGLYYIYTKN